MQAQSVRGTKFSVFVKFLDLGEVIGDKANKARPSKIEVSGDVNGEKCLILGIEKDFELNLFCLPSS